MLFLGVLRVFAAGAAEPDHFRVGILDQGIDVLVRDPADADHTDTELLVVCHRVSSQSFNILKTKLGYSTAYSRLAVKVNN